jgi:hypothetical protein
MSLIEHAQRELDLLYAGTGDEDYDGLIRLSVMHLMELFASQEHSGGSADAVIALFTKLANFENILPLDGNPDDWIDVREYHPEKKPWYQCRRNTKWFSDDMKTASNVMTGETMCLLRDLVEPEADSLQEIDF